MKKIIFCMVVILSVIDGHTQNKNHDSLAILIVDRMADMIGDLQSCSFKLHVANDVVNPETGSGFIKRFTDYHVFMSGRNKLHITSEGDKGHRQLWYNGEQLAYYFANEKNYGMLRTPPTTLEMIDTINALYQIDFPAADFFYPTFTDDVIRLSDQLKFLGTSWVNGRECFHVASDSKDMTVQFWISNDAYNLPSRFVIVFKNREGHPQYQAVFSDWEVNPALPVAMFDFQPPPGSAQVRMISKNDK